jgi:acetyl-CoA carboxylase biotin carboxylase subunit
MFSKILIANRGEIAVRVIRACREMGIAAAAVYSEADRTALHVRLADQAIPCGPAAARESYLNISKMIEAAVRVGAQAVHPGYGFLSENADFAEAVEQAGLTFIGPSPAAIRAMGDKAESRRRMQAAGIPVVPGYQGSDDAASLAQAARQIGFPLLVKAVAGGGGRGMRVVNDPSGLAEAIAAARREAETAFGNGRLLLERYIPNAHHVEFQVLADVYGTTLHLFERECSVQRRYQKIIEWSPSLLLSAELRAEMGQAAVAAARSVGYHNAGTIEFIFDPYTGSYYFLEMNTRLQVEHPVTELVANLDLVQWQIRIAAGERLPFSQADLSQRGQAIECRVYAEDPSTGFLPASGPLIVFNPPSGPGVRFDTGFTSGDEISLHYDPLLAKLIVHAEDLQSAVRRMQAALQSTVVIGLPNNLEFLQAVLSEPDFAAGGVHTTWVEQRFTGWQPPPRPISPEVLIAAALSRPETAPASLTEPGEHDPASPWRLTTGFRIGG